MKKLLISLGFLAGCTTQKVWDGPEFEWVEPVIFQNNLEICRAENVCLAETLFE